MIDWQSALLGGIAFVVVLGVLYLLILKTTSLGDSEHDEEGTSDRLDMGDKERHRRVGFRHRVSRQTPMAKAVLVSFIIFLAYLAIAIYRVAETGSPSEALYTEYVEYGIFGMVCVVAGVLFKAYQNAKAGEIQIILEDGKGSDRRTVPFNRSLVRETDDGTRLVPELKKPQVFKLFWRPMLAGDDPKLRDSDHRLPDDLVMYEVPTDDSAVWDDVRGEVTVRAKKVREVDNPNRAADYEIVPSDRKSKREILEYERTIDELEQELNSERVQINILSDRLSELEAILTNEEDAAMQRIEEAKEVAEPNSPTVSHGYDEREENGQRPISNSE